ncbi:hypothetical protein [Neolewinella aurantiaca]|nr:hypothetical protein [Neolewinella aurantiaca]
MPSKPPTENSNDSVSATTIVTGLCSPTPAHVTANLTNTAWFS